MQVKIKRLSTIPILAFAIAIGLLVSVTQKIDVYATGDSKDIYYDSSTDSYIYETDDPALTTSIGFETQGFTIHKNENGVASDTVFATVGFADSNITQTYYTRSGVKYVNTKKAIPGTVFRNALMKADPTGALLNDYNTGTGILHVNGVMRTFKVVNGEKVYEGSLEFDDQGNVLYNPDGSVLQKTGSVVYGFDKNFFPGDMQDIMKVYAWNSTDWFKTHFHKILPYMHGDKPPAEIASSEITSGTPDAEMPLGKTGQYGKDQPEVWTWHTDETYDVGEGIPSGETFVNSYVSNKWYGTYAWEKVPTVVMTYNVKFEVEASWHEHYTIRHRDGTTDDIDNDYSRTFTDEKTVVRKASWWALRSVDFKELAKVTVTNDAYGNVTYNVNLSVPYECIINGTTPSTYQEWFDTSEDQHVIWPEDPGLQSDSVWLGTHGQGYSPSWSDAFGASRFGTDTFSYADNVAIGMVQAWNDKLVIDGHEYLSNQIVTAKDTSSLMPEAKDIIDGSVVTGDGGDYGKITESKDVTVPIDKENGKYDTKLEAMYEGFIPNDRRSASFTKEKTEAIKEGADDAFGENKTKEPVVVHTPVVSPVTIYDKDGNKATETKTQIDTSGGAWNDRLKSDGITSYDMLLDEQYTIEFDPYKWLSELVRGDMSEGEENNSSVKTETNPNGKDGYDLPGYGTSLYDKYVRKREVAFPFPVAVVNEGNGEETFYELEGDYTQWVEIDSNSVKIYIPTWATESEVKFGHANQNDYYKIKFRVTAVNAGSGDEDISNSKLDNYVATFEVPCSISGWIYDFTITGTSDSDMYEGYDSSQVTSTDVAFSMTKEEKKTGTLSRIGEPIWKYLIDGLTHKVSSTNPSLVTTAEARNLIPLRDGSSSKYTSMGSLWKGSSFSYLVKSISSLTSDGDTIVIKPTLRYYNYDNSGNFVDMTSSVKMYYSKSTSSGKQEYVLVGSNRDELTSATVQTAQLGETQFDGARYQGRTFLEDDDDVSSTFTLPDFATYTARKKNVTLNKLLTDTHKTYTLSKIKITSDLRLYTGSAEELRRNSGKSRLDSSLATTYNGGTKFEDQDFFTESMQTWYGKFSIPDEFYVTKDSRSIDEISYSGELSKNSDIWESGGYLVVNFEITAYHNGQPALSYQNGSKNMWEEQGQLKTVTLTPTKNGTTTKETITLKDGDVAIYDLSYSSTDKISSHIHNVSQ